jgi:hypothetical protein
MSMPNPITFAGALLRMVWAWLRGDVVLAPTHVEAARLYCCMNTCLFCDREDRQCPVCTCFIDLKAPLATERCPKGYWGRYYGNHT